MASKKQAHKPMQAFCTVQLWLDVKDPELSDIVNKLCMQGSLMGRKTGVTFLYPTAAVRKEIIEKATTDDPSPAVVALQGHIIKTAIHDVADFRKGVGTLLGILLEVESASGDTVVLKNGAKLKPAADFRPLSRSDIAVWEVVSGEIPLDGPKIPPTSRARATGGGTSVSREVGDKHITERELMGLETERYYGECMKENRCSLDDKYLSHVTSLLNFLKIKYFDVYTTVLPILDRDPAVSFYLLIEPYKKLKHGDHYLIPNSILFGAKGWDGASVSAQTITEFENHFKQIGEMSVASATDGAGNFVVPYAFADASFTRGAIDAVRLDLIGDTGDKANIATTPERVHAVYETLGMHNKINDVHPVFPNSTIKAIHGTKKLWQDEFRFIIHNKFKALREDLEYSEEAYQNLRASLRFTLPGTDYSNELSITKRNKTSVNPHEELVQLIKFITSSDFLYFAVAPEQIEGGWGDIPVTSGLAAFNNPMDLNIYNAEVGKQKLLNDYRKSGQDDPHELNQGCITAVLHAARSGALPHDFRALLASSFIRADNVEAE